MKLFFLRLITFLFIPLVSLVIFELGIVILKPNILNENTLQILYANDHKAYDWVNQFEDDTIIILAGSSSVRYGLSCKVLNNLSVNNYQHINLAMDARDPIQTYFILKNLPLHNIKKVYFGLDPWIYTKQYYKQRSSFLYIDFTFKEALYYTLYEDKFTFIKRYVNVLKKLTNNIKSPITLNSSPPIDYGSIALKQTPLNFNNKTKDWFQTEKYGWSVLQFEYAYKLQQLCVSNNIYFAVFLPPKRSDFSEDLKQYPNIKTEFLSKLSKAGLTSPIYGTFDQLDSIGDFDLFAEPYHLNDIGQQVYSKLFYEITQKPGLTFNSEYNWFK